MSNYDNIINMEYPLKIHNNIKHPDMSTEDRAKIFAPFAALKGYEEAIASKQQIFVPKIELSEESKEALDQSLSIIEGQLNQKKHPIVEIVYFKKAEDYSEEDGKYIRITGKVAKYEPTSRMLQIVDKKLNLDQIYSIVIP